MKVVVTGAAGMIGANLLRGLNAIGIDDIIAVDDLSDGAKYANLAGAQPSDYVTRAISTALREGRVRHVDAVLHQGALRHDGAQRPLHARQQLPLLEGPLDARRPRARGCCMLVGCHLRRQRGFMRSRRRAPLNVYGYSAAVRQRRARMLASSTCRSSASATSTSTGRASSTRRAWPRSRSTTSTSSARPATSSCSATTPVMRRVSRPRLRVRRRRGRGEPVVSAAPEQGHLQPGTGGRSCSTMSRSPRSRRGGSLARAPPLAALVQGARSSTSLPAHWSASTSVHEADLTRLRATGCPTFADGHRRGGYMGWPAQS